MSHTNPLTRQTFNVFCPTGKGGGVDPSCGKGGVAPLSDEKRLLAKKLENERKGFIPSTEIGYHSWAQEKWDRVMEPLFKRRDEGENVDKELAAGYKEMGLMKFEYFAEKGKLTKAEQKSVGDYWHNNEIKNTRENPKAFDKLAKASPPLEKDYVFYRGMTYSKDDLGKLETQLKAKERVVFKTDAPFSITGSVGVAQDFASGKAWKKKRADVEAEGKTALIMEIVTFKGQKIGRTAIAAPWNVNESIMPSNASFEVISMKKTKTRTTVRVALVSSTHNE